MAQRVKNLPVMQETPVQPLGWEDSLQKGMATHSSILAWRINGQRNLGGYTVCDVTKSRTGLSESLSVNTQCLLN